VSAEWMKGLLVLSSAKMSPQKTGLVYSVFLSVEELGNAAKRLCDHGYSIEDVSVVDTVQGFMVVYHFDRLTSPGRVALRILAPHDKPEVPSISEIFSGANWHERECHDFFGVIFTGHPNLVPLLLPEDAKFHPLLKSTEEKRSIPEIMSPGDVEVSTPAFEALFPKQEREEDGAEKPDEKSAKEKSTGPGPSAVEGKA
jgi:NADH-quinone oxidoreductase subunit C